MAEARTRSPSSESWVELTAADGHRLEAFMVTSSPSRGTVVVLQEIFGVNEHIQNVARRVACLGYTAIAPALFDRVRRRVALAYDQAGIAEGKKLVAGIPLDSAMLDVAATVNPSVLSGPVAVLGFCWGGTLAWLAAGSSPLAGAVAYYGGQIGSFLESQPKVPMLTHFGDQDASISLSVPQAVKEQQKTLITHIYPAGHGFNCDERPGFHAESASLAWQRTAGFLSSVM
ncbi:MAG: dienelactone hydrolase family protein [Pseudomonadota bacterium]